MYGLASISEFPKRVDLFSRGDWERSLSDSTFSALTCSRDPIRTGLVGFPFSPVCVWCFERRERTFLIISGDVGTQGIKGLDRLQRGRMRLDPFAALAPLLLKNVELRLTVDQLVNIFANSRVQKSFVFSDIIKSVENWKKKYLIEWVDIGDISLAMLIEKFNIRTGDKSDAPLRIDANSVVHKIAGLIVDYHAFRLPIWRCAPPIKYEDDKCDVVRLRNAFSDPLSFDPRDGDSNERFLLALAKMYIPD